MRGRFIHQAALAVLLICQISVCLAAESSDPNSSSKYLNAVREFADNVLKYGRDTYGPMHTPLFVDGLNVNTHEPVKWIDPEGERWILSNLASQQNLFRTLDGLTRITGDPKYKQAAMDAIEYAFENLRSPNGLLYWGGHTAYDLGKDKTCGSNVHELKGFYPYYELMWEIDSKATKQFIEAFWSGHILNWSNLDMDRHCYQMDKNLEKPWEHTYKGGPIFFESWGFSPLNTGGDLFYAAAILYKLSGKRESLIWGKRLAYRYVETRNPKTGFISPVFTVMKGRGTQIQSNDEVLSKLVPVPYIFPYQGYANRALWECHFGYDTPTPGITLNGLSAFWLCQLMLGELLGEEGKEFTQWAIEELTAWGKVAYRSHDNAFTPMFLDGTSLEGYVCKEDGPLGFKGTTLEPVTAGPTDFWAYTLAYCQTDSEYMWEMTRNIAHGNNYGDLGVSVAEEPQLNLQTDLSDPYVIIVFLELHRKTNKRVFLEMARRIGDNILIHRFRKGFVAPEDHTFTKLDSIDPLVLLHLHAALIGNKRVNLPRIWPSTSFFESAYRKKDGIDDNQLIYSLKDVSEPPISLQEAAAGGNVEAVKSMIARGVNVNGREDGFYKTALHRAAISGHKDVAEFLLTYGADVNARASGNETPLYYAVEKGHKDIAELLIANGADINAKNNNGQTPVDIAVNRNRSDLVKLLIEKGDISFYVAVRLGDLAIVKSLIEKGADINAKDASGRTTLHYAVEKGHKDIAELLIAKGANVNARDQDGNTPAHIALGENNASMLVLLIEKGANLDSIHLAARKGDMDKVKSFIGKGTNVNETDSYGATPLHYAAVGGSKEVVEFLIAKCAYVNVKKKSGDTPLHGAVRGKNKDVVVLLIYNGANVNARGRWDYTPIYYAAWSGITEMVELLIEKGADVNAKDEWGWTPLHYMAQHDYYRDMAEFLVVKGADVNAKDKWGVTPLEVAKEKGHIEIVELLKKHTGDPMSTMKGPKSVLLSPSSEDGMDEVCDLILDSPALGKQNFGWDPACGDVNGDGYDDIVATAAAWDNGARRGRVYLYYGGKNMDAIPDKTFTGEVDGDYFGDGCGVGDVNGDGYDDVLVGVPCFSGGAEDGRVYVFHGGPNMDEKADLILEGESGGGGYYGIDIGAGDLNKDGYDDVVVTAVKMNSWKGRAYLYYGGNPMDSTCDLIFEGENENDAFGRTVFLGDGDVNGEHYPDLLIQAKQYPSGKNRGRIYLYYGGDPMDNICDKTFTGENDRDEFGEGNCLIDVDNDGFCDVIIGADCWPAREKIQGRVYLYWGSKDMDGHADKTFTGEPGAALSVVYGGYFNNDEYGDILIGAWGYKHFDLRGQAHIYHGGIKGQMDEVADCILSNDAPKSRFGMRLTSGDVNGDDYDDAIINGFGYKNQQGRIWLFHGGPSE